LSQIIFGQFPGGHPKSDAWPSATPPISPGIDPLFRPQCRAVENSAKFFPPASKGFPSIPCEFMPYPNAVAPLVVGPVGGLGNDRENGNVCGFGPYREAGFQGIVGRIKHHILAAANCGQAATPCGPFGQKAVLAAIHYFQVARIQIGNQVNNGAGGPPVLVLEIAPMRGGGLSDGEE
jgi:hypothetical protein